MKVLLLRSNPRKNGYTQRLTDLFVKGSREAGADITDINLCEKDLKHCRGVIAAGPKRLVYAY